MNKAIQLGLYGKLPGYGDFVHRNLPNNFLTAWDEWLQSYIAGSKDKIGEAWLDIYLTSPLWRFVLSAGVIDDHHWAGVVLPSVDQVGRYYPFSIVIPLPANTNPLEFMAANGTWYEHIEELALQALDTQLSLEEMIEQSQHQALLVPMAYDKTGQQLQSNTLKVDFQFPNASINDGYAHLLDSLLTSQQKSYSVWSTSGSEKIQPCLFTVPSLPSVAQLPAMMDGHWGHWGWTQTYVMNENAMNRNIMTQSAVIDNTVIDPMIDEAIDSECSLNDVLISDSMFNENMTHNDVSNNAMFSESMPNDGVVTDHMIIDNMATDTVTNHNIFTESLVIDPMNEGRLADNMSTHNRFNDGIKKEGTNKSVLDELNIMNTKANHHE